MTRVSMHGAGQRLASPPLVGEGVLAPGVALLWLATYFGAVWSRAADPIDRYLPHELALLATAVLIASGWRHARGWLVVLGAGLLLWVVVEGFFSIPVSFAACQEWAAGGRLRFGAF